MLKAWRGLVGQITVQIAQSVLGKRQIDKLASLPPRQQSLLWVYDQSAMVSKWKSH